MYKLLIVDDEPLIRKGLANLILWEELGVELAGEASDGVEAWDMVLKVKPHIVLCDIKMSEMDGIGFIKKCYDMKLDIKIIVISGYDEYRYVREALKYGAEDYLLKPVSDVELKSIVVHTLDGIDDSHKQHWRPTNDSIFLNNIVYRLVTGNMTDNEIREKLSYIGIHEMDSKFFRVAVFDVFTRVQNDTHNVMHENLALVYDVIRKLLRSSDMICTTADNKAIIVFGSNVSSPELIQKELTNILESINKNFGIDAICGVGAAVEDIGNLNYSLQTALHLTAYKHMMVKNRILWHEVQESQKELYKNTIHIDFCVLDNKIAEGDCEGAEKEFCRIINTVRHHRSIHPKIIKCFFIDFTLHLISIMKDNDIEADLVITAEESLHDAIISMNFDKSVDMLKGICCSLSAYMYGRKRDPKKKIDEIVEYVDANLNKPMSLITLAAEFGYSPAYMGRAFRQKTGEFFSNYVNSKRIDMAIRMINKTSKSINNIARELGYDNTDYFYKQFRKYTGVSPSNFRYRE